MQEVLILEREDFNRGTTYTIGAVYCDSSDYDGGKIVKLWDRWRKECPEPDTDSEFMEWLESHSDYRQAPLPERLNLDRAQQAPIR